MREATLPREKLKFDALLILDHCRELFSLLKHFVEIALAIPYLKLKLLNRLYHMLVLPLLLPPLNVQFDRVDWGSSKNAVVTHGLVEGALSC